VWCGNFNSRQFASEKVEGTSLLMTIKPLHPGIWWLWAGATSVALARVSNFWLSIAVVALVSIVVFKKSEDPAHAPWVRSYRWALQLGIWIVAIRTLVGVLIGVPSVGTVLFTLPTVPLPTWMAGIRMGGAVTQERLLYTVQEGLMLAAIIVVLASASALTNPHRLLRSLPIVIYEFGVAVVIATTLVPQIVGTIRRIREAQRLRGQTLKGFKSWSRVAIPLLEESLSRSLDLAAAMDSRGYGISKQRSRYRPTKWQWNEYVVVAIAALTLFAPMMILVSVVSPMMFAPDQRLKRELQVQR